MVNLMEFSESSLNLVLKYEILTAQEKVYRSIVENNNLKIMTLIESLNLQFAFPTRTILVDHSSGQNLTA